jgi:hypothetical protein
VLGAPGGAQGQIPHPNGAMKGHPPELFDGNRKNTKKFMKEFRLWKLCNMNNEAMVNPFLHIALALSYIKGINRVFQSTDYLRHYHVHYVSHYLFMA